jgi:hypothetical protein
MKHEEESKQYICSKCDYGQFDHYVEGAPRTVYTCEHPNKENIEEDCPLETKYREDERGENDG